MASPSRLPSVRGRPAASGRSRPVSMIEGAMLNVNLNPQLAPPMDNGSGTSKQAKRRSWLPQFARRASGSDKDTIKEGEQFDGASSPAALPGADEPRKAMAGVSRREMQPPSKLSRPMSLYGAGVLGRAPSVETHLRDTPASHDSSRSSEARKDAHARLTGAAPAAAPPRLVTTESGLKRTPSIRPPQQPPLRGLIRTVSVRTKDPQSGSGGATTTTTTTAEKRFSFDRIPATAMEQRPTMPLAAPGKRLPNGMTPLSAAAPRPVSGRARPPSVDSSVRPRAPSVVSPTSPTNSTTSRHSTTRAHMPPPPPRQAFSTYQQHYSPAKSALPKAPVPPTRTMRPVAPVVEDEPMTAVVARQQIELLQLSLLHQASTRTLREYEASAKRKLNRKQAKLAKECESIQSFELEQRRVANLLALDRWSDADSALLAERLQTLNRVYTELLPFVETGSRYAQLVAAFGSWLQSNGSGFVEALPSEWHRTHTSLALRLRSLQRELEILPPVSSEDGEEGSSVEVVLGSCSHLLEDMLTELELMGKIEKETLRREKHRVEEAVKALTTGGVLDRQELWVPAWQSTA